MFPRSPSGDAQAEREADVLSVHPAGRGGEHGKDLLVGGAGDGRVDRPRRVGLLAGLGGQLGQGLAGDRELSQFGLGEGESNLPSNPQ